MRYQALTIALLSCAALSCSRRPALKVEVDGIPKQARSLQVLVVSQDSAEVIPRHGTFQMIRPAGPASYSTFPSTTRGS